MLLLTFVIVLLFLIELEKKKHSYFELQKISQTLTWHFILCSFKNKELNGLFSIFETYKHKR